MLFGVVYLILCGVNHTRGHGVNIVAMACLYFVRIISITDVTVGGFMMAGMCLFAEEP